MIDTLPRFNETKYQLGENNGMQYNFITIDKCNMCGARASNARVLGRRMNGSQGKRPPRKIGITTSV